MQKLTQLYMGKAKKMYATDNPEVLWVEYMNQATAGNGAKKAQIEGKGRLNNQITTVIFQELAYRGIASHFISRISETEQLVRKMDMYPLEIIMRNVAAGSFSQRYGVEEGTLLKRPALELCLKDDALGDPFINDDDIQGLGLATADELEIIAAKAREINHALTAIFNDIDVTLVDFKVEMGKTSDGTILLADEITPDTCRLWDKSKTGEGHVEHLDKDLFRRNLGDIIPAYEDILDRLTKLHQSHPLNQVD